MKYSKILAISFVLLAILMMTFVGCDNRVFDSDKYRITSIIANPTVIYSDNNITYSTIRARVLDKEDFPVEDQTVRFRSDLGQLIATVKTNEMGIATTTFWDNGDLGLATIEAFIGTISKSVLVDIVETPEVETVEIQNDLTDLALEIQMTIRAEVINTLGEPVADGTMITFSATKGIFPESSIAETTDGIASVQYNTGTSAGLLTITARLGDKVGTKTGNINPGFPASISLMTQMVDEFGDWINVSPEGIPVNFPRPVRIRATVKDMYNNMNPGTPLEFETTLGGIQGSSITDENGVAYVNFFPGQSAGTAQITARTVQAGEGGDPITGITLLNIYSDAVHSISFEIAEEIFLDVIGVGGVESRSLRVELRDYGGNLVSGQHWVKYEIIGSNPPTGVNINNVGLSDEVQANDGVAVAAINSGTGSGTVKVKVSLVENPDINATKANIVIRSGPPSSVIPTIGDFDTGVSMGGGIWQIEAGAVVKDQYNNPVINGTAVWFSLADVPQPPPNCYIDGSGYTGNSTPSNDDGTPGYAGTFLYYHGANTFDQVKIIAESGEVIGELLATLPINQPRMEMVITPGYHEYFNNDPLSATQDGHIIVSLQDGQGNPVTGGNITMTSTHCIFEYYDWLDPYNNPINDETYPHIIKTYAGEANGTIRSRIWECPEPIDDYVTTVDVQVTARLLGTNTITQGSFTIRRYRDIPRP
ncbi:MAG: Ig-like domain-containing protein [Candidatus Cloacimonetes bacterium]|nr:Ig-like domain-containing protein [Candidatus Cloacimonadota bacterium]